MEAIRIESPCLNDWFIGMDRQQVSRRVPEDQTRADGDSLLQVQGSVLLFLRAINPSDPIVAVCRRLLGCGTRRQFLSIKPDIADWCSLPAGQSPLITERDRGGGNGFGASRCAEQKK